MKRYIDAEKLNKEWPRLKVFGITDTLVENLTWIVDSQPAIEVSEDCIGRKKLIEQIYKDAEGKEGQYGDTWKFIDTIELAPSVIPKRSCYRCGFREDCEDSTERKPKESEWIPCCERLPKDNGHYICSFTQTQRIDKIHIGLAYLENGRWVGYNAREINAWMPLPKPWKGADDE